MTIKNYRGITMKLINVERGTEIELGEIEQLIVKGIAKKRHENNRSSNVKNSKIGSQTDEKTDVEGFGAEIAFCKLHNLYPDFSIHARNSSNDEGDASLHIDCGVVDIKGTCYETGKLITPEWKNKNTVDLYALMVGTFPKYTFKGFMKSSELMQKERLGDLGYGKKSYIAYQSELKDLSGLIEE
jgi:hypothetical protein